LGAAAGGFQSACGLGNFTVDRHCMGKGRAGTGYFGAFAVVAATPFNLFDQISHVVANRHIVPPWHQIVVVPLSKAAL
jgi:hypothetical protein